MKKIIILSLFLCLGLVCIIIIGYNNFNNLEAKEITIKEEDFYTTAPILLTKEASDRSSAYTVSNKIITSDVNGVKKAYFAYSKNDGIEPYEEYKTMSAWVATYNYETNQIENETLIGYQFDNHGNPAITIDKDGYLHIVFGSHGEKPIQYRKSVKPNDSSSWEDIEYLDTEEKGKFTQLTYPVIKVDSENNIHVVGSALNKAIYFNKKNGIWSKPKVIMQSSREYARYHVCMTIDKNDDIHILVPDLDLLKKDQGLVAENDLYYFKSVDKGSSFSKKGSVWNIDYGNAYYNTLAVDSNGNPHFTMIERNGGLQRKLWHVYFNGQEWEKDKIDIIDENVWEAKVSINDSGKIIIIAQTSSDPVEGWNDKTNNIYLIYTENNAAKYNYKIKKLISSKNEPVWLPTIQENELNSSFTNEFWVAWNEGGNSGKLKNILQNKQYLMKIMFN